MRRLAVCLLLFAVGTPLLPADAAQGPAPVGAAVRFEPVGGGILRVEGRGPFRGVLEVRREGDGLTVVNELPLEEYVMGLAEVPGSWPMESLKAQAVAARTYALWEAERGYWQRFGFELCATTACQVYAGALAERGDRGRRWVEAVRATEGQILEADGRPILARYHASSGGRTLPNEAVYPSSGPRPYLKAVDDPGDDVSPLHRWTVDFTREELQAILREAIDLAGELVEVQNDEDAREVTIRTEGGEVTIGSSRFRMSVSDAAPELYPRRFPSPRNDGLLLPMTLPSSRFTVERTEDGFRLHGKGYGHGVGMSQWGAKGFAEQGMDHREILSHYYSGVEPAALDDPERVIRVGIVRAADDVTIFGDGGFAVRAGDDELAPSTVGSWSLTPGAARRTIVVDPPEGVSLPLVLSGVQVPEDVVVEDAGAELALEVSFVVPKSATVRAEVAHDGEVVGRGEGLFEAGLGTLPVPVDPGDLPHRGDYEVTITAFDGADEVTEVRTVSIRKAGRGPLVPLLLAAALALVATWLVWRRGDRASGPPSSRSHDPEPSYTGA